MIEVGPIAPTARMSTAIVDTEKRAVVAGASTRSMATFGDASSPMRMPARNDWSDPDDDETTRCGDEPSEIRTQAAADGHAAASTCGAWICVVTEYSSRRLACTLAATDNARARRVDVPSGRS